MRKLPEKRPPGFSCVFTSVDISQEVVQKERTSPKQQLGCMKNCNQLKALGLSNGMHVKLDNSIWGHFLKAVFYTALSLLQEANKTEDQSECNCR